MNQEELKLGCSSLGEWLVKIRKLSDGEIKDSRLKTAGRMEESTDSQGGFLVPEDWANDIYNTALEGSIVRSRCDTILKVKSDSLPVRRLNEDDRSSALFGGITFTWTAERGQKATLVSKPDIGQLGLTPHKLVGSTFVSNELENDIGGFGDFMKQSFGQAIRFIEDAVFINGTGAGQPQGILGAGGTATEARQAVGEIEWADIANMAKRLLPNSWERAVWLVNPEAIEKIFDSQASAANQVPVLDMSRRTLWGRPFIVTEKVPALGSEGDLTLADFGAGHYVIADREMRIAGSRHVKYGGGNYGFVTDETFWKVVLRVDGQPLLEAPLTPYYGGNTLSPFVALSTTSS